MSGKPEFGRFLHRRGESRVKGEPLAEPLVVSSMYHLPGAPEGFPGYGRINNPTRESLEDALSFLEDAPALAFPSGMAAISAAIFATVNEGNKVLIPSDGYYVTRRLAAEFLSSLGVTVVERPTTSFSDGGFSEFDVVYIETPSNPGLDVLDIAEVAGMVKATGGVTIVDNTTMTPLGQRPLELGADIVVMSDTKAMGGHSDILMGHVATRNPEIFQKMRDWRDVTGAIPGPHDAWLLLRGMETLEVRFERMCSSAQEIAHRLAQHLSAENVRYPGLESDASFALATRQMLSPGFIVGATFANEGLAEQFIAGCPLLCAATSFGGTHSSAERRARWGDGVSPGYVRISVGCEPLDELCNAIEASLAKLV